jgi:hypothetical protein
LWLEVAVLALVAVVVVREGIEQAQHLFLLALR